MKKSLKLALIASVFASSAATVFAGNEQTADEARDRLNLIAGLDADQGLNADNILNGLDQTGRSKNRDNQDITKWADLVKSDDAKAQIVCVSQQNTYTVYQMNPKLVGHAATGGLLQNARQSLAASQGKITEIPFIETTPGIQNSQTGRAFEENAYLAISQRGNGDICMTRFWKR